MCFAGESMLTLSFDVFLFVFWAVWCIFYSFKNQKVSYNRISRHERHGWPKCLNTERNMFSIHLLVTVVILKINMKMGFLNTAWFHSENTQSKMVSKPNSRILFPCSFLCVADLSYYKFIWYFFYIEIGASLFKKWSPSQCIVFKWRQSVPLWYMDDSLKHFSTMKNWKNSV